MVFCNYLWYLLSESLRTDNALRLYLLVSAVHNYHLKISVSLLLKKMGSVHVKQYCGTFT